MLTTVSPFDPATGVPRTKSGPNFSAVFGAELVQLATQQENICAVTAAMQSGTGLDALPPGFRSGSST